MKTLLVPVSRQASAEEIKKIASFFDKQSNIQLHLLHVITIPTPVGVGDAILAVGENLIEDIRKTEEKEVNSLAAELRRSGYEVNVSTPIGFFDQELIALANRLDPFLIVMLTDGSHNLIEDIFGTNTSHVFERIRSPLLVIPKGHDLHGFKNVVVGLHLEEESPEILKKVIDLSEELNWELNFVKIDNNYQLDIVSDEIVLKDLRKRFPDQIATVVHRPAQDTAKGLTQYAEECKADLLVLYTVKRHFLEKLFHKSVTRDLILHSKKPLLIYHY